MSSKAGKAKGKGNSSDIASNKKARHDFHILEEFECGVQLKGTETGNIYSYLHLNMRRLRVSAMDTVSAGDTIGFVSNDFGSTPTTYHLHFEIKAPIEGEGIIHVPPYMSLVTAYERREGGVGELVEDDTVSIASFPIIPDDLEIIE